MSELNDVIVYRTYKTKTCGMTVEFLFDYAIPDDEIDQRVFRSKKMLHRKNQLNGKWMNAYRTAAFLAENTEGIQSVYVSRDEGCGALARRVESAE